jgi:predicted RND superfamily exporter protein
LHRTATNSQFEQAYDSLVQSGYLRVDPADGKELWRISVRVAAFENIDYGQFSRELQQVVQPEIAEANERATRAMRSSDAHADVVDAVYTGVIPIVYKAQRALLESLIESTMWSFLTIAPLLMVIARGIRAGFVTMLPNVLPVLVIFGGMGWLGIPIDIGSMMSASIALGVAVDDTIHYLTWFRHDLDESGCRHSAILSAYSHCATPTLQAALINGLGLAVFAFSTFTPTKQFGFLMLTILIAGVVAELVLLPALLAGPLGRVFQPTRSLDTIAAPKLARNTGSAGPLKSLPRQVLRNHSILRR